MSNVIEEFLISIGFRTDEAGFGKLRSVVAEAERSVVFHSGGMAAALLEVQAKVTAGFTAISGAIAGVVDKVVMGDQAYRTMGARMLMTKDSARELTMITKALGASLEEIIWDPTGELQKQASDLASHYAELNTILGPDADKAFTGWRNFRVELEKMKMSVEFLGMKFVSDLFARLDPNAFKTLENWIAKLNDQLPTMASTLADVAMPILKETWNIFKSLGFVVQEGALAFTNFIGLLSGDQSIQGTTFDMQKFGQAILHVTEFFEKLLVVIATGEKMLADFASALTLAVGGQWRQAWDQLKADLTKDVSAVIPELNADRAKGTQFEKTHRTTAPPADQEITTVGTVRRLQQPANTVWSGVKGLLGWAEAELETAEQLRIQKRIQDMPKGPYALPTAAPARTQTALVLSPAPAVAAPHATTASTLYNAEDISPRISVPDIPALISETVQKYNESPQHSVKVPVSLALAVARQESNFSQEATSTAGARGVMQLMPETAKTLGVDREDTRGNITGGVALLGELLTHFNGNLEKTLAAYNAGQPAVDRAASISQLPAETRSYVPAVLHHKETIEKMMPLPELAKTQLPALPPSLPAPAPQFGGATNAGSVVNSNPKYDVTVGGIYINQPGADEQTIQRAVAAGIYDRLRSQTQFDLANLVPAY